MSPLKIRNYVKKDLEAIVGICNEALKNTASCWPNPMTLNWFRKRFESALEARNGMALVAEHHSAPVGYVLLTSVDRPEVGLVSLISGICIIPKLQRMGVGSKLMGKAIDWAKKQNAVLMENDDEIIENPAAVNFFEKLGFEIFHKGVYMSKDLTSGKSLVQRQNCDIRELEVGDLDQLLTARREAFKEFGPWYAKPDGEAFKKRMENRIGRDDVRVFVALINHQVIGYVVCSISETDKAFGDFRNISVVPKHRNKGVATALMNHAFDFLKRNDVRTACTATETAEGFYEKVGFKVDKRFVRVRRKI